MTYLWNLIPSNLKIWAIGGLLIILLSSAALITNGIYQRGYSKCESDYRAARMEASNVARARIIPTEKHYEAIKGALANQGGDNPLAGPHVAAALDRLP